MTKSRKQPKSHKILTKKTKKSSTKPSKYNLVYMAKPPYGGWVTFTAHLSNKYNYDLDDEIVDNKPLYQIDVLHTRNIIVNKELLILVFS